MFVHFTLSAYNKSKSGIISEIILKSQFKIRVAYNILGAKIMKH